jgi:hypothetical protein
MAPLPQPFRWPSDRAATPVASRLGLAENHVPLAPRHASHAAIAADGGGRYSHWDGTLLFSTRDGSDPNTNGCVYTVYIREPSVRMLAFGSCNIHAAVSNLESRGLAYAARRVPVLTFTPREALQLIEAGYRRVRVPEAFRPFAAPDEAAGNALPGAAAADCVLLEFVQAIDVRYDTFGIMRTCIYNKLIVPVLELGPSERRIASRWYQHGLIQRDEAVRLEAGRQLLELLPRIDIDQVVAREIVTHARGEIQSAEEVEVTVRQILQILRIGHACVVSSPNTYMPDGRPVAFPVDFPKDLKRVCAQLDLPLFDLGELVASRGGDYALDADLYHFTPRFTECYADELLVMSRRSLGH